MVFNSYPNAANKPRFSFDVPVPPPDIDPDEGETVCIALSVLWIPVVLAALQQLTLYATWVGTDEEKILAVDRASNLIEIVGTAKNECGLPTPFWDEVTDTGDEASPDTQTWYGYVDDPLLPPDELTFIEQVGIWAFSGFLALSGAPAAAILFNTLAPRFTLAMRGDDFAEVIRIIFDGEDMARVATTGDPDELIQVPIVGEDTGGSHQLLIVKES